jgi:transposase
MLPSPRSELTGYTRRKYRLFCTLSTPSGRFALLHQCVLIRPPYCPELNPIERVWRDLKDDLTWQQFSTVDVQQDYVGHWLRAYDTPR